MWIACTRTAQERQRVHLNGEKKQEVVHQATGSGSHQSKENFLSTLVSFRGRLWTDYWLRSHQRVQIDYRGCEHLIQDIRPVCRQGQRQLSATASKEKSYEHCGST